MKIIRIVVVVLIPLLLAVGASHRSQSSMVGSTHSTVRAVETALDLYQVDTGSVPTLNQGLSALITNPEIKGWNGPYIRGTGVPTDAWGTALRYRHSETSPRVFSAGADRTFGTEDDIDSTKKWRPRTRGCMRFR